MIQIRPTVPPVRVVTTADTSRVFHEHGGRRTASILESILAGPGWVELAKTGGRYVCPRCNREERANNR